MIKKILLITPELEYTGALNSFKRICEVLLNNKYTVDIWTYNEGPYINEFDKLGVYVEVISEDDIDIKWVHERISQYSLVIANTIVVYKCIELIQNLIPVVWYIREAENIPDFFWKIERKWALEKAKKLYVVSEYAKDFITSNYNQNVEVLHNYVDDVFSEKHEDFLGQTNSDKLKFLTLGTIEKRKGYDVLLQAFIDLPVDIRDRCELHFAGRLWEGAKDFSPKILSLAKKFPNIFYHGELRDRKKIHSLIFQCNVVVVPSRDESCSLVALEGAMMSKPLILTENIGAKYILDEKNGWLVKTGNVESLKNAFIQAYKNKDKLDMMGANSRNNYLQTSTYEIYEKNILKMVQSEICENQYLYHINQEDYVLFSFDIFDTLISRDVAKPNAVFLIMKQKMQNMNFPLNLVKNFDRIRVGIEQYYYQNVCKNKHEDVNFDEIYNLLQQNFSLSFQQKEELMKLEIDTEKEVLYPIKKNIELIEQLVRSKKRVVLISDMYFNSSIIRIFLSKFSPIFNHIPIYMSSEFGLKKNSGNLFKAILNLEKVNPKKWIHYGDNWVGDYFKPANLEIATNFYINRLLPHEEFVLNHNSLDIDLQRMIGISKKIRLENTLTNLQEIGVSFGAPMLLPYVQWVLNTALKNSIKCLYFIARDGYILQKMADILIQANKIDIKTKYLYGSRESWREPFRNKDKIKIQLIDEYLEQEIDKQETFAFVECCGTGETLDYIVKRIESNRQFKNMFFGSLYLYRSKLAKTKTQSLFMLPLNEHYTYGIELFIRSLEGQVVGYSKKNNKVIPIFDFLEGEALQRFGYSDYIDGVMLFVRYIVKTNYYEKIFSNSSITILYLNYLKNNSYIDKKFIEIMGSVPFVLNGVKDKVGIFAPRLNDKVMIEQTNSFFNWSVLRSCEDVKIKYNMDNDCCFGFIGAVDIIKSHLSYKLGRAILLNIKNPLKWIKLIILIPILIFSHYEQKKIYSTTEKRVNIDLSFYKDYKEAVMVKNFFSYQLGELILKTSKKWNILAIIILPYKIIQLYRKKFQKG
ncbi:HAD-IA family hydrolase [Campylobacter coli]